MSGHIINPVLNREKIVGGASKDPHGPWDGDRPCDPVTNRLIILYRLAFVTPRSISLVFPCLMRCLFNGAENRITYFIVYLLYERHMSSVSNCRVKSSDELSGRNWASKLIFISHYVVQEEVNIIFYIIVMDILWMSWRILKYRRRTWISHLNWYRILPHTGTYWRVLQTLLFIFFSMPYNCINPEQLLLKS